MDRDAESSSGRGRLLLWWALALPLLLLTVLIAAGNASHSVTGSGAKWLGYFLSPFLLALIIRGGCWFARKRRVRLMSPWLVVIAFALAMVVALGRVGESMGQS